MTVAIKELSHPISRHCEESAVARLNEQHRFRITDTVEGFISVTAANRGPSPCGGGGCLAASGHGGLVREEAGRYQMHPDVACLPTPHMRLNYTINVNVRGRLSSHSR